MSKNRKSRPGTIMEGFDAFLAQVTLAGTIKVDETIQISMLQAFFCGYMSAVQRAEGAFARLSEADSEEEGEAAIKALDRFIIGARQEIEAFNEVQRKMAEKAGLHVVRYGVGLPAPDSGETSLPRIPVVGDMWKVQTGEILRCVSVKDHIVSCRVNGTDFHVTGPVANFAGMIATGNGRKLTEAEYWDALDALWKDRKDAEKRVEMRP